MAKKMAPAAARAGVPADKFRSLIADINRAKDAASEASGLAGQKTQQACETHGLEKTAFTFTARLERMEPAKRGGIVRSMFEYFNKAGFFDQIDAFDDLVDELKAILAEIEKHDGGGKPDEAMDAMLN